MQAPDDTSEDIPSPIDLRTMHDAQAWTDSAMQKRPCRQEFFNAFVNELHSLYVNELQILELGSGPGFLAEQILKSVPNVKYTMLDFSAAMHELARQRLGHLQQGARFVLADFKEEAWTSFLQSFEAIVTMQAVHELRHKRHALKFHSSVLTLLRPGGVYLVCDHYTDAEAMTDTNLFMSVDEQRTALENAGFKSIQCVLQKDGLVLHRANRLDA
jgi:ubiquinone/menaquinone biosynthesis C-methylase UbiE